jgi:hypothetical protein
VFHTRNRLFFERSLLLIFSVWAKFVLYSVVIFFLLAIFISLSSSFCTVPPSLHPILERSKLLDNNLSLSVIPVQLTDFFLFMNAFWLHKRRLLTALQFTKPDVDFFHINTASVSSNVGVTQQIPFKHSVHALAYCFKV